MPARVRCRSAARAAGASSCAWLVWTTAKNRELRAAVSEARWLADRELLGQFATAAAQVPRRDDHDLPGLRAWLVEAEALVARLAIHEGLLEDARQRGDIRKAELLADLVQRTRMFAAPQGSQLSLLRSAAAQLADLRRATIDAQVAAWRTSAAAVRNHPAYAGFTLRPQLGLVPLGIDRDSGLCEFGDVRSGTLPERDANGRLAREVDAGVVFVLVPPRNATAHPLFVAKHELTQGQYLRLRGNNPAQLKPGRTDWPTRFDHPAENLTWVDCAELFHCLGWRLPTFAEWQHAARGGSTSRFLVGDAPAALLGFANLADHSLRDSAAEYALDDLVPGSDGFVVHAPVGTFAANRFGLHDVIGNVSEWCADADGDLRVAAGGSFLRGWSAAEVDDHRSVGKWDHTNSGGVRPVRTVE